MLFSRWKVMTGLVGLSVGGIAAFAAQGSKPEVQVALPAVPPPASVDTVTPPVIPTVSPTKPLTVTPNDPLPSLPVVPAAATTPTKPTVDLPIIPDMKPPSKPETPAPTKPTAALPPLPDTKAPVKSESSLPALTPSVLPPMPTPPTTAPQATKPTAPPDRGQSVPSFEPPSLPMETSAARVDPLVGSPKASPTAPVGPPATVAAPVQTKFRIVLRVGEGEPSFEVRHGDDLVMKVTSEKVDIKSPEKGQGLSNVTAMGKVRFVGFGAEGTCDSLSFLAGTAEVSLTGNVNVKVRDKIGRVESELNADKMQYKLDQTALTGVLKP